jgi:hypothetical protein
MRRRKDPERRSEHGIPLLDAEMWDAPARLSREDCLEEIATDLGGCDRPQEEDTL